MALNSDVAKPCHGMRLVRQMLHCPPRLPRPAKEMGNMNIAIPCHRCEKKISDMNVITRITMDSPVIGEISKCYFCQRCTIDLAEWMHTALVKDEQYIKERDQVLADIAAKEAADG